MLLLHTGGVGMNDAFYRFIIQTFQDSCRLSPTQFTATLNLQRPTELDSDCVRLCVCCVCV